MNKPLELPKHLKNNRVELHPATDAWMQGDRYGSIQARWENGDVLVRLDKSDKLKRFKKVDITREFATL